MTSNEQMKKYLRSSGRMIKALTIGSAFSRRRTWQFVLCFVVGVVASAAAAFTSGNSYRVEGAERAAAALHAEKQ